MEGRCQLTVNQFPDKVSPFDEKFKPEAFKNLFVMQKEHFWYKSRHYFIFSRLLRILTQEKRNIADLAMIDLGAGCGGWIHYLQKKITPPPSELALGDLSIEALNLAREVVDPTTSLYHNDLKTPTWQDRWDVIFLLDVIEHIHDDVAVINNCRDALKPGGLMIITTPALHFFWSYNDEIIKHYRRYSKKDYQQLAVKTGVELIESRYFMTFLSPLLYLSRIRPPDLSTMSEEEINIHLLKTHRIPNPIINRVLELIFNLETPLNRFFPLPFGTSILTVLKKSQ